MSEPRTSATPGLAGFGTGLPHRVRLMWSPGDAPVSQASSTDPLPATVVAGAVVVAAGVVAAPVGTVVSSQHAATVSVHTPTARNVNVPRMALPQRPGPSDSHVLPDERGRRDGSRRWRHPPRHLRTHASACSGILSAVFTMRFAMRSSDADPGARAALYGAAIEMAQWSETRGCLGAILSQHHGVDDGYLPSPVPLAAAMAARTTTLPVNVAALLLALYEPVKLAEDLAVVDLISRGRVSYVVGIGYRDEEFAMFGVDRRARGQLVEERILLLRRLWSGEGVVVDGRPVRVTPLPYTPGGPFVAYGGGTAAAAQRAGRLGMMFMAETHDASLEEAYRAEGGEAAPGCFFPPEGVPLTVFVADDPERAWAEIGSYLLADAVSYSAWNATRSGTASISRAESVAQLAAEHGAYQIVTPVEAGALVARTGFPLNLQPLVGGLPPHLAWPYLEAAAAATGA